MFANVLGKTLTLWNKLWWEVIFRKAFCKGSQPCVCSLIHQVLLASYILLFLSLYLAFHGLKYPELLSSHYKSSPSNNAL